ncbi:MAG: hypothetical protein ABIH00_02195 [Armatimonadota bacterium]
MFNRINDNSAMNSVMAQAKILTQASPKTDWQIKKPDSNRWDIGPSVSWSKNGTINLGGALGSPNTSRGTFAMGAAINSFFQKW